jgi:hypothetical protein
MFVMVAKNLTSLLDYDNMSWDVGANISDGPGNCKHGAINQKNTLQKKVNLN